MRRLPSLCLIAVLLSACAPKVSAPVDVTSSPAFTPIPTFTSVPLATPTSYASLGTVALDFIALLCNAQWLNGGQHLTPCPSSGSDNSGGYAAVIDPLSEGLPAGTPLLLTIPAWNGYSSLFLRYPSFTVRAGDRFRTTLQCRTNIPCDIEFALEYIDSYGVYHSLKTWDYKTGDAPILVDDDLSRLSDQTVEFALVLRLFHTLDTPQQDNGLWIAPHIYRPIK